MFLITLIIVSVVVTYVEVTRLGMPVKRWLVCSLLFGPAALLLMRVHYRRAFLRLNHGLNSRWCC